MLAPPVWGGAKKTLDSKIRVHGWRQFLDTDSNIRIEQSPTILDADSNPFKSVTAPYLTTGSNRITTGNNMMMNVQVLCLFPQGQNSRLTLTTTISSDMGPA